MPDIYAIADLHLSHTVPDKSMDVFGALWADHTKRLEKAWRDLVKEEDLVLVPGDISWAMNLSDAAADLAFLDSLPGQKLLLRGNHDYWWSSVTRIRAMYPGRIHALQNDVFRFHDVEIAGTRGWTLPGSPVFKEEEDRKLYDREKNRLQLSLGRLSKDADHIVMFHYPPFSEKGVPGEPVSMLIPYNVKVCVYGHLHGTKAHESAFQGDCEGIRFSCVAADLLQFEPKLIWSL